MTDPDEHRAFAAAANNRVWELLADESRDEAGTREMVDAVHASLWHWRYAGTLVHEQRGVWLVSHVYAVLGHGDAALTHAMRCWALTEEGALGGFDHAYACEAMARAHAARGDVDEAARWRDRATTSTCRRHPNLREKPRAQGVFVTQVRGGRGGRRGPRRRTC